MKGPRAASAKRISDPQPLPGQQTFGVEVAEKTRKREVLRTQVSEGALPHGVEAVAAVLEIVLLLLPAHVSLSQREAERALLDLAKASRERTVGLLHQVAVGHAPVELVDRASSRVVTVDVIVAESLLASGVRELRAYLAGAKLSQPEQPLSLARASLDGVALVPQEIDGVVGHGVVAPDGVQIRTAGEEGLRERIEDAPGALAARRVVARAQRQLEVEELLRERDQAAPQESHVLLQVLVKLLAKVPHLPVAARGVPLANKILSLSRLDAVGEAVHEREDRGDGAPVSVVFREVEAIGEEALPLPFQQVGKSRRELVQRDGDVTVGVHKPHIEGGQVQHEDLTAVHNGIHRVVPAEQDPKQEHGVKLGRRVGHEGVVGEARALQEVPDELVQGAAGRSRIAFILVVSLDGFPFPRGVGNRSLVVVVVAGITVGNLHVAAPRLSARAVCSVIRAHLLVLPIAERGLEGDRRLPGGDGKLRRNDPLGKVVVIERVLFNNAVDGIIHPHIGVVEVDLREDAKVLVLERRADGVDAVRVGTRQHVRLRVPGHQGRHDLVGRRAGHVTDVIFERPIVSLTTLATIAGLAAPVLAGSAGGVASAALGTIPAALPLAEELVAGQAAPPDAHCDAADVAGEKGHHARLAVADLIEIVRRKVVTLAEDPPPTRRTAGDFPTAHLRAHMDGKMADRALVPTKLTVNLALVLKESHLVHDEGGVRDLVLVLRLQQQDVDRGQFGIKDRRVREDPLKSAGHLVDIDVDAKGLQKRPEVFVKRTAPKGGGVHPQTPAHVASVLEEKPQGGRGRPALAEQAVTVEGLQTPPVGSHLFHPLQIVLSSQSHDQADEKTAIGEKAPRVNRAELRRRHRIAERLQSPIRQPHGGLPRPSAGPHHHRPRRRLVRSSEGPGVEQRGMETERLVKRN